MLQRLKNTTVYFYISQLVRRYNDDDLSSMSAQITYFLILAFFPFLFFLINLLSFTPLPNRLFLANFNTLLPANTASLVKEILLQTVQAKSKTLLFIGMIGSLWAASRGMAAIIRGLNHAYDVKETRNFFTRVMIEFAATVALTVMILFLFFLIVLGRFLGSYLFSFIGEKNLFNYLWPFFRYGISLVFLLIVFYFVYMFLPNRRLKSKNIILGALFTTIGWVVASLIFSFYVNNFANYANIYGSLGGVFALIIWLHISALIFLFGGELNAISHQIDAKKEQSKK